MKKSFILALLLFALSAAALLGSHSEVNAKKDAITITETVLYGDRAAAEGITVLNRTHNNYHLFWDTSCTIGNELEVHTDFLFSQEKQRGGDYVSPSSISMTDNFNYTISGNNISLEDVYEEGVRTLPMKLARAVAGRTPAGETNEEIIYLKDYYDFYPLFLELRALIPRNATEYYNLRPNYNHYDMTDYLKIPVSETQRLRVSVTKDSAGNITRVRSEKVPGVSGLDRMSWYNDGVFTVSGCYFYINLYDENETVALPEEASGIHYVPLIETDGSLQPFFEETRLAYPLDIKTAQPLQLLKSPDEGRLMLFAKENDLITLSVIEAETMSLLQKTVLFENAEDSSLRGIKQYDDFFVAFLSDGRLCLLQEDENGLCEIKLRADLYECSDIDENAFHNEMAMDYDGQRLAIVFSQERNTCSSYLMVYEKDSLAYAGKYDHSGDRYVKSIEHWNRDSRSVSFG